ncbi:MAG: hypothetical protein RBT11_05735 [Desulfobacterales bacterium]|nr:hypothetical protein [Desulfobacterales bacterium]
MRLYNSFKKVFITKNDLREALKNRHYSAIPPGEYAFLEHYCDDKDCDCRRVIISALGLTECKVLATINMGLDPGIKGVSPFLDPLGIQSEYSSNILTLFLHLINTDTKYLFDLQQHYIAIKETVSGEAYSSNPFEMLLKNRVKAIQNDLTKIKMPESMNTVKKEDEEKATHDTASGQFNSKEFLEDAKILVRSIVGQLQHKNDQGSDQYVYKHIKKNPLIAFSLLKLLLDDYAPDGTARDMSQSYQACLSLLVDAMTELRYSAEENRQWAVDATEQLQHEMASRAFKLEVDTRVQADLVQALYKAKLELHPEIKTESEKIAEYYGRFVIHKRPADLDNLFEEIAAQAHNNPFSLMEQVLPEINLLPVEGQVQAVTDMAGARNPLIRELSALMLLHPNYEVRQHVPSVFEDPSIIKNISPVTLRRMIGIRNWLPKQERPALDGLIKKLRMTHLECAPLPKINGIKVYASPFDGAGAQGILNVIGQNQKSQLSSVLIKQGLGIRSVSGVDPLNDMNVESILIDMNQTAMLEMIDSSFEDRAISYFIWVGQQQGMPPPAGLLHIAESIGSEYWIPEPVNLDREIDLLEEGIKLINRRVLSNENLVRVLKQSRAWPAKQPFANSWFEDDPRVDELLLGIPGISSRLGSGMLREATELIVSEIIEAKYDVWAERLLWVTLWAKACKSLSPLPWEDFFIVARQFRQGLPAKRIPVLVAAAERSVSSGIQRLRARPLTLARSVARSFSFC